MGCSNKLIGTLNAITFLLSVPVLAAGIWLGARGGGTECERYLSAPLITLGVFLMAVSLAGLVGACCRVTWLLWVYLVAMFVLIVALFCLTVFTFVVSSRGAGEAVSGRGFKEYRLGDYSHWLQKRVENTKNWNKIRSCLQGVKVCKSLQDKNLSWDQFTRTNLSPVESGCCKPPTSCGFIYVNSTQWAMPAAGTNSTDPDCRSWSNDQTALCFGCQSCKAGVVAALKQDYKSDAIVNIVFVFLLIIVYSVGCCAFRNNRRDNHKNGGWKNGGYA